jgi:hypothetical protein
VSLNRVRADDSKHLLLLLQQINRLKDQVGCRNAIFKDLFNELRKLDQRRTEMCIEKLIFNRVQNLDCSNLFVTKNGKLFGVCKDQILPWHLTALKMLQNISAQFGLQQDLLAVRV